jgi:hypothetical protein
LGFDASKFDFMTRPYPLRGEREMIDRYTKGVLTVIAAALVVLAVQGLVGPLGAQIVREPQKVQLCDSLHCASLTPHTTQLGGAPVTDWVLPMRIDGVQKVEICGSSGASCATIDGGIISVGSLRVSSR